LNVVTAWYPLKHSDRFGSLNAHLTHPSKRNFAAPRTICL
jgi:hypothetical protein